MGWISILSSKMVGIIFVVFFIEMVLYVYLWKQFKFISNTLKDSLYNVLRDVISEPFRNTNNSIYDVISALIEHINNLRLLPDNDKKIIGLNNNIRGELGRKWAQILVRGGVA